MKDVVSINVGRKDIMVLDSDAGIEHRAGVESMLSVFRKKKYRARC